jgi:hypothetical protein
MRKLAVAGIVLGVVLATGCEEIPTTVHPADLAPSDASLAVRTGETFTHIGITTPSTSSISLGVGSTSQMAATLHYSRGGFLPAVPYAQWRSTDDCVATVTSASPSWGLVRGVQAGTVRIVASAWGKADTVTVTVRGSGNLDPKCADRQWLWDYKDASFTGTPVTTNTVASGETLRRLVLFAGPRPDYTIDRRQRVTLQAELWYNRGGKLMANSFVSFTSTDESVATVSSAGVVRGRNSGRTKIIARLGQYADTVPMYVR